MKQLISFLILFIFTTLLLTPNLAAASLPAETTEIPYQINYSDRIITGTVNRIVDYGSYTIITITVNEWLYNPLPAKTIRVRTETGSNFWTEDEAEFTHNESVLVMLKDKDLDKQLFSVATGFPGKYPASDRDAVIKELKTQGKWKKEDQIADKTNNTEITANTDKELTFGPGTLDELKSKPNFIAAYGKIPAFTTFEEREQWLDTLDEIYSGSNSEMSEYMYPNGVVTNYGYTIDGIIKVGVNKTVEKPLMDEIYQIFDSLASVIGINEVPVVFFREGLAVPTGKVTPAIEPGNLSNSGDKSAVELNNNSNGDKSSGKRFAPGLGLLGGLTCLYGAWKLGKK
ncbi:MAG: hypothetical protein ABFD07_16015 [Methanobacterium sp.]